MNESYMLLKVAKRKQLKEKMTIISGQKKPVLRLDELQKYIVGKEAYKK